MSKNVYTSSFKNSLNLVLLVLSWISAAHQAVIIGTKISTLVALHLVRNFNIAYNRGIHFEFESSAKK